MTKSIVTLTAAAFVALPLMAAHAAPGTAQGIQMAQSGVPAKCAELKDAKARADCIKKERGS